MSSHERPHPTPEFTKAQTIAFDRAVMKLIPPRNETNDRIKLPDISSENAKSYRKGELWIDIAHPGFEYIPLEEKDPDNTASVLLSTVTPSAAKGYMHVQLEFYSLNLNTMQLSYSQRVEEVDANGKTKNQPLPTKDGELDTEAFAQRINEIIMLNRAMGDYDMTQKRYERVMSVLGSLTTEDEVKEPQG